MTNIDSILKSRGITLSTKVHLVKAMIFPEITTSGISLSSSLCLSLHIPQLWRLAESKICRAGQQLGITAVV